MPALGFSMPTLALPSPGSSAAMLAGLEAAAQMGEGMPPQMQMQFVPPQQPVPIMTMGGDMRGELPPAKRARSEGPDLVE